MVGGDVAQDIHSARHLLGDCYGEIRRISRKLVSGWSGSPLQATELVHEAALRLLQIEALKIEDRGHMLALAARIMRQAMIDEVRRLQAAKRQAPELITAWPEQETAPVPLDVLDEALTELVRISPEHAEIVEMRFTLGMTVEEAANASGLSPRTIKRRWQSARAWLYRYLDADRSGSASYPP